MLENLNSSFENFILNNPIAYISAACVFGAILAGIGAYSKLSSVNDKYGTLTGKVTTQDNGSLSGVNISLFLDGIKTKDFKPKVDGSYSVRLERASYRQVISSSGYSNFVFENQQVNKGTNKSKDVTLLVEPKPVSLQFIDKLGAIYSNLNIALMKGLPPGSSFNLTSNPDGMVTTDILDYGQYNLVLIEPPIHLPIFAWAKSGANYFGNFILQASSSSYNIVLPKLIYSALTHGTRVVKEVSTPKLSYFAQKFSLDKESTFEGLGIGVGLGGVKPIYLEIRADMQGNPADSIILQSKTINGSVAISTGSEAIYSDLAVPTRLLAGTYWLLAKFEEPVQRLSLIGSKSGPTVTKISTNGLNWENFNLPSDLNTLDLFLVQ